MFAILGLLLARFKGYIVGGFLIAGLVGGGYLYVSQLRTENQTLKAENKAQADTIEFFKKAAQIDTETKEHKDEIKEVIQSNDPKRVHELLLRLRRLSAPPTN